MRRNLWVRWITRSIALWSFVAVSACASQPLTVTRTPATIRLVASDACRPLAEAWEAAYEETHPWVSIEVTVLNSRLAEEALVAGDTDIALLLWLRSEAADHGVWSVPIGYTGIAIVTNPSLPITDLRLGDLYEMYRGRLQQWEGHLLVLTSREDGSGTRAAFESIVLRGQEMSALMAVMLPSTQAVLDFVAATPDALGYIATVYLAHSLPDNVQIVSIEGIWPTQSAIASETYPLRTPIYIATVGEPVGPVRDLAQWMLGPAGQRIAAQFGRIEPPASRMLAGG